MAPSDIEDRDPEEPESAGDLLAQVYEELRGLARRQLDGRPRGATIHTTALVHEAWSKLSGDDPQRQLSRPHFLALAATAMRHVLANHAEKRTAAKRGGGWRKVTLSGRAIGHDDAVLGALEVSEAIDELWSLNERHGRLAEMRLMAGMTPTECADVLKQSVSTVERDWRTVRAWLGARFGRSA